MTTPQWRRALVTGASSGIGRAFAVQLGASGTDLVLVARRRDRLDDLAAQLRAEHGTEVEVLVADLTDESDLVTVETRLGDETAPVDLLVNNAGFATSGRFADLPVDREVSEILLNVLAPVRLTRAVLPGMVDRRHGGVVNVSSIAALQPLPHWATYAATKAYLTSFSEAVHEEVRGQGVVVLALMPGFTHTEFHGHVGPPPVGIPGPFWMDSDQVVKSGLAALDHRRARRVPGGLNRMVAMLSRLTPRAASRRMVARIGPPAADDDGPSASWKSPSS
ncbi:MAG: SDR family oxidoreductase [Actinomycetota bacterium]|nr:SDR family oxidoreductase [Actinomycetota bacterium]